MTPHRTLLAASLVLSACLHPSWSRADDPPPAPKPGGDAPAASVADESRAEQRALVEKLFGPEIWDVKDHADFAQEPQWRKALHVVASLDRKFVDDHQPVSLNTLYDEILKDPAAFRGRFVRIRGVVGNLEAVKLDEKLDGRGDVFRGQASGPDGEQRVMFDILDRPPAVRRLLDQVEIDGVFYRTVRYETRNGTVVEIPWIVARAVVVLGAAKIPAPAVAAPAEPRPDGDPAAKPPVAPPANPDAAADAASDAKAREILAKAAALQNAGDLAEPGKLDSFHVVFRKATFERTTTKDGAQTTQLVETDTNGLVFDWMKGSVKTQVTIDERTTTKAWYDPIKSAWIHDGTTVSSLLGAKYKSDYDQLQFHRTVVTQLLDVAILGKLLKDRSRWRVVADPASPAKTVAIERTPPADAKGAVAIRLWISNPSEGVYGDVVAASMPPTPENSATVFYDFTYDDRFPAVRVRTGDAAPAESKLRFPFAVTVHERREGSTERTKVLEVFTASVDVNTVVDDDFKPPKSR